MHPHPLAGSLQADITRHLAACLLATSADDLHRRHDLTGTGMDLPEGAETTSPHPRSIGVSQGLRESGSCATFSRKSRDVATRISATLSTRNQNPARPSTLPNAGLIADPTVDPTADPTVDPTAGPTEDPIALPNAASARSGARHPLQRLETLLRRKVLRLGLGVEGERSIIRMT